MSHRNLLNSLPQRNGLGDKYSSGVILGNELNSMLLQTHIYPDGSLEKE